jgi:hypothetical protein
MLPHAWQAAGWAAVGFVLLGMLVPSMMERLFRHASARIHTASLVIGFFGLAVHGLSDGAAFSQSFKPDFGWMISAVLLHRLPEGLLICSLFQKQRGFLHPWVLIGFLSFSTVLGYYLGQHVFRAIHNLYLGYFQALISGSLLHAVVDFHPPSSSHPHDHTPDYTHDQHPT